MSKSPTPEELKLIAESMLAYKSVELVEWRDTEHFLNTSVEVERQNGYKEQYFPENNYTQAWELMQAYRNKMVPSMRLRVEEMHCNFYFALESPEALIAEYLQLIKGEGEAS